MDLASLIFGMILGALLVPAVISIKNEFQRFCLWLVWDGPINLGRFGPIIFDIGMGQRGRKVVMPQEIHGMIDEFLAKDWGDYQPEHGFAHLVLGDLNLTDSAFSTCIGAYDFYMDTHPQFYKEAKATFYFLQKLESLHTNDRERFMQWYHFGIGRLVE